MKKKGMEYYVCQNCDKGKDITTDKLPYREDMYDYGQIEYSDFMWYLSKSGELRITGTGAMPTFKIFREYENVGIYPSPSGKYDGKYVPTGKPTRDVNTVPWKDYLDKIKTVVVEDGCTEIGSYAFCNCVNLEKVTLPKSVERLGNDRTSHSYRSFVFVNCQKLKEVIAPGVQYAATYTFSNCSALEYVELPSIKTLIYDTFYNCPSIKKIVLGKNLTNVCLGAAENCQIDAVYFYGDAPEITDIWGAPKNTPVFSNADVVYYAQGTSGWTSNWGDCNVKPFNP